MLRVIIIAFLLSLSPLGEARAGIPFAILNDIHFAWAFVIGFVGNAMVFPLVVYLNDLMNKRLWRFHFYRRLILWVSRRAKKLVGTSSQKYGFWGLMFFVMVPLPGTGSYWATIAASVLKIDRRKAFYAISLGTLISCVLMAGGTFFGNIGLSLLGLR